MYHGTYCHMYMLAVIIVPIEHVHRLPDKDLRMLVFNTISIYQMTFLLFNSNTASVTIGASTVYRSGAPEITLTIGASTVYRSGAPEIILSF